MLTLQMGADTLFHVAHKTMTGKQAFNALSSAYGTDLIADLTKKTPFSRQTLQNWIDRPDSEIYGTTEKKLERAIAGAAIESRPDTSLILAAIHEVNANVERLRADLFRIREQSEKRAAEVVIGKGGHRKGGGAA